MGRNNKTGWLSSRASRRCLVGLAALVGAAALFWFFLPDLAGRAAQYLADKAGLHEPHFTVSQVGWRRAELEQAHFRFLADTGALTVDVENARLHYTLDWQKSRLHTVTIGHARLAWQGSTAPASGRSPRQFRLALPFERLEVGRLDLDVVTELGHSSFSGAAQVSVGIDGAIEIRLQDGAHVLHFNLALSSQEVRLIATQATGAAIFQSAAAWQANGAIHATLDADANALVEWLAASPVMPDKLRTQVAGQSALRHGVGQLGPRLAVTLDRASQTTPVRLTGRLVHEGRTIVTLQAQEDADGVLEADVRLAAPLAVLSPFAVPLLPPEAAPWWPQTGEARGRALLRRAAGEAWAGAAYVAAEGVGLNLGALSIAGGKLHVDVTDLRARQATFSAELPSLRLTDRVEASQLALRGQYQPGRLSVQEAEARLFGGRLAVVPVDIDPSVRPIDLTVVLHDIDLTQLLQGVNQEGLSGEGKVSGGLPLIISGTSIEVREGTLHGDGAGVLRYRGPAGDPNNIAFKALRNLAYHSLKAKLDYHPDGEYRIGLRLEGKNPELLKGHPIAFNLNLTGKLEELLRAGLVSGDWGRSILERAGKQRRDGTP